MRKTISKILVVAISLFSWVQCDNHEFPKSAYPRVETLPVVNISETGVTFQGSIIQQGELPSTNHGFVWGLSETPTITGQDKVQLGPISALGNFEAPVQSGLSEGKTYYVRAFVATSEYLVYGESESFVSQGSTPPVINSILPDEGTAGDTVIVKGRNFSSLNENNKLKFGQTAAFVLASTDSTIQCIIPGLTANQHYPISLDVVGNSTVSEVNFHVLQGTINSMTPSEAIFGDTITITGENFPARIQFISLAIDGITQQVLSSSRNTITFVIPNNLINSHNHVSANISGVVVSAGELTITPPTIADVANFELSLYTNPPLVISGSNFNPIAARNQVRIGGYACNVLSASLTQLTIQAPEEIIPDVYLSVQDTFDIEVQVLDQSAAIGNKISVSYFSRWTRMKDFPGNARVLGVSVAVNGKGYIGLGSGEMYSDWYTDFWEYEPVTDTWTQLSDFPGQARAKFTTLVIGSKIYIVGGIIGHNSSGLSDYLKEVWEFDPASKNWTRKNDFPGNPRAEAFGFVLGSTGYFGCGESSTPLGGDFWRYSRVTDTWTQLNDIPNPLVVSGILALSNGTDSYILTETWGGYRLFWKYDKVNDAWQDLEDMPGPYTESTGFALNGNFYAGTGISSGWPGTTQFYEFNVSTGTWSTMDFKGTSRRTASSFAIGNYGYLLLGRGECHCANLRDVWRFDPSKP